MEWTLPLAIGLVALLVVLVGGLPIYVGFLLLNLGGVLWFFGPSGFGLFANSVYDTATSPALVTIPLFVLMGEILFRSGTVEVAFDSVDRLVGRVRGRLYHFTIALSTLFGALSGSAVAVVAMLGRSVLPIMKARGYDMRLSASVIQGGASLAPIIPPSLMAVLIGSMADVSIADLLVAGIVPGLMLAGMMVAWVAIEVRRKPNLAPPDESSAGEGRTMGRTLGALARLLPFGTIVFSVMGLILLGIATPSEAAATGVIGAMATAAWYRRLSFAMLNDALAATASISTMILAIVCASVLFGQLLAFTGATGGIVRFASAFDLHPAIMLLLLMAVPFVLCMFVDQLALMLVAIPIYVPIVKALGWDPIWFWTLFSINMTLGSLTPPFGYTMFALHAAAPKLLTLEDVFAASWPVTWVFVLGMLVMALFPSIVTFLPGLF